MGPQDQRQEAAEHIPERDRDYFLERMYPGYGNLVPRDIASRAIFRTCYHEHRGIYNDKTGNNENEVYLDLTHKDEAFLRKKLAGVLEIYEKFAGVDPYKNPMKVFPAVHYSMGGLWSISKRIRKGRRRWLAAQPGDEHPRSLRGGEVDYQYPARTASAPTRFSRASTLAWSPGPRWRRLGRHSRRRLRSAVFDLREPEARTRRLPTHHDAEPKRSQRRERLRHHQGSARRCFATARSRTTAARRVLTQDRRARRTGRRVRVTDTSVRMNQGAQFVRHLENMLLLARVIAQGARNRDESRGAHFKPDFPKRDDARFMRTTLAKHKAVGSVDYVKSFDYVCAGKSVHVTDEVDVSLVKPRERKYERAAAASMVARSETS